MAIAAWRVDRIIGIAIALAFLGVFFVETKTEPKSWNDIARVATIESLVERGTWAIDDSLWIDETGDKVFINGRFYSDKMPFLTLIAAGVYSILHFGFGASLAPNCANCAYSWITFVLVGIPAAFMIWLFFDFARRRNMSLWVAIVGTLAFGLGTMIFPYALVFNHHLPAAAAMFASFHILTQRSSRTELIAAGFLAALAISFDALTGLTALGLFAVALVRYRRQFIFFVIGAAVPVMITALLDYQFAGTIIPAYMITSGYDYPGSAFPASVGGNSTPDDYAAYAFRMFLGGQGLFAYNPLLLFASVGALIVIFKRAHPLRVEAFFVIACFVALCIYLALFTGNLGGVAYGERWCVAAIPMLFAFIFFAQPLNAATWKNAVWLVFVPLLALSVFSSLQGAQSPWLYTPPPLQMTRNVNQFPIFGFKWNVRFP